MKNCKGVISDKVLSGKAETRSLPPYHFITLPLYHTFGFTRHLTTLPRLLFLLALPLHHLSLTTLFASRAEMIYDGNFVQKTEILNFNGNEYIPLKSIATLFKGKMHWYPIAGKVILQLRNQKVSFALENRAALIGERKAALIGSPRLIKGAVFVPIDFFLTTAFTEIVDCNVRWNSSGQMLTAEPRASLYPPRIYSRSNLTRIVIESVEEFSPEIKKKGENILVDIPKARIAAEEQIKINDKIIRSIGTVQARRGVSLKIALASGVTAYTWIQKNEPPRLILEIYKISATVPEVVSDSSSVENGKLTELILPERQVSSAPLLMTRDAAPNKVSPPAIAPAGGLRPIRKIVVDAGHGGNDPGAVGRLGTKEKEINLLIALELARILRIEGGYEVLLTRADDNFVSLVDRTIFANDQRADLFISIHCNASLRKTQGGFEVYFLAEDSSDPHAEAAAQFENSVVALEGPPSPQKQKLQELLLSMARTEFINESSLLCSEIAKAVGKRAPIENRGVKQADFHVLHGAQMPSILIETAFLTHPPEEQKLRQRKFRSAIVDAILTGVENYQKQLQLLSRIGR